MIRQGDILLRPVPEPQNPQMGEPISRLVLAVGEATGHEHALVAERPAILAATGGGRMLVRIMEGVNITHPDHDPVPRPVDPGWYEIHRKREYVEPVRGRPRTRRVSD